MKKSQMLSRKTWKMLAKNLIILAVLGVVAFVGVMSWFTTSTTATADGISVRTESTDGLEYYIVAPSDNDQYDNINSKLKANEEYNKSHPKEKPRNTSWHTSGVTFDFTDPEFKFMEDIFLCEVTGDGNTFKIPKLIQYGEVAYVDKTSGFDDATENEDFMSFDIYFRSEGSHDIAMKSDSSIVPNGTIDATTEEGMKNAAIGAVRLSVMNRNNRELLWIPGPNVWYDGLANKGEGELKKAPSKAGFGNGSVTYNGSELVYTGEKTSEHAFYNASRVRDSVKDTSLVASTEGDYNLGKNVTVVTLNQTKNDGYHYGHVRVNLWIEGEDAEARLKFVGGKFDMKLKFTLA